MASKEASIFDSLPELIKANDLAFAEALSAFRQAMRSGNHDYFTQPNDEPDRHYDRNGYCDNPSRGY